MIRSVNLKNFRAFRAQSFNFARLNVFVGPNNSGKSSALSALNVLAQTMTSPNIDAGPIILNGQFDELGTFKDVVYGGRSNTPIGIEFSYSDYTVSFEIKHRQQRRETELSKFKLAQNGKPVYEYLVTKDRFDLIIRGNKFESLFPNMKKPRPTSYGFWPLFPFYRFDTDRTTRRHISTDKLDLLRNIESTTRRARMRAVTLFRDFDSLSPFRAQPLRTYLYSGETSRHIGRTGENAVMLLANDSAKRGAEHKGFVDSISKWMAITGISGGIKVKTLTPRHFELCVLGKDGTEHNICDVGFGCSQVLPVLVSGLNHMALAREGGYMSPVLVVQEPEIHLHPNAQASLGSFFASLVGERGQIFLETHSDNLVLRIARHVASGELLDTDVKVFYFEDIDGQKEITEMQIKEDGTFEPSWPGGFFPQRQSESLALARTAMGGRSDRQPRQLDFFYPEEKSD